MGRSERRRFTFLFLPIYPTDVLWRRTRIRALSSTSIPADRIRRDRLPTVICCSRFSGINFLRTSFSDHRGTFFPRDTRMLERERERGGLIQPEQKKNDRNPGVSSIGLVFCYDPSAVNDRKTSFIGIYCTFPTRYSLKNVSFLTRYNAIILFYDHLFEIS